MSPALRDLTTTKTDAELGRDLLFTYRYLRVGMIALLVMLLFGFLYEAVLAQGCFLGSISGYYFTPARSVFVGSLCGLGALLIVHKARTAEEDVLLDFSGVMAFVVAFVPTVPDTRCGPTPTLSGLEVAGAVRNNIWALIVVVLLSLVARHFLTRGARGGEPPATTAARVATIICGAVLVGELGFFLLKRDSFIAVSHGIAAGTMVLGVIAVMVLNAVEQKDDERSRRYRRIYFGLAIALGVALGATIAITLATGIGHVVLLAEVIIIVLFIGFWAVQTKEFWDREANDIRRQVEATRAP